MHTPSRAVHRACVTCVMPREATLDVESAAAEKSRRGTRRCFGIDGARRGASPARTGTRRVGRLSPRHGPGCWSSLPLIGYDAASRSFEDGLRGRGARVRGQGVGQDKQRGRRRLQAALTRSSLKRKRKQISHTGFAKWHNRSSAYPPAALRDELLMRRNEDRRGPKCRADRLCGGMVQRHQSVRGELADQVSALSHQTKKKVAPGIEPTRGSRP
jgi:hypothetical protein